MSNKRFIESSKIIIANGAGEFLLMQRSSSDTYRPGEFELSGGELDPFEQPVDAAVREVREEVGLRLLRMQLQFLRTDERNSVSDSSVRHFRHFFFYESQSNRPVLELGPETTSADWFKGAECKKLITHHAQNYMFREVFSKIVNQGILSIYDDKPNPRKKLN